MSTTTRMPRSGTTQMAQAPRMTAKYPVAPTDADTSQ